MDQNEQRQNEHLLVSLLVIPVSTISLRKEA